MGRGGGLAQSLFGDRDRLFAGLIALAVAMDENLVAIDRDKAQILVGIDALVVLVTVAHLEIERVAARFVYQMMAVRLVSGKTGSHAGLQRLRSRIGDQFDLAFQDVDELFLLCVPVAQRRGSARRQAHQVDAVAGDARRIAEDAFLTLRTIRLKALGIAAADLRFDRRGIDGRRFQFAHDAPWLKRQRFGRLPFLAPLGLPLDPRRGRPTFLPPKPWPVTRPAMPPVERGRTKPGSETPRSRASSRRISSRSLAASSNSRSDAAWRILPSRSAMVACRLWPRLCTSPATPVSTVTRSRS